MNKGAYERSYARLMGMTVKELHGMGLKAVPCNCNDDCAGWQMITDLERKKDMTDEEIQEQVKKHEADAKKALDKINENIEQAKKLQAANNQLAAIVNQKKGAVTALKELLENAKDKSQTEDIVVPA